MTHGVRALHASRSRVLVRSRTYLPWRACNFIPRFILHFKCSLKWVTAVKNDTMGQFRERAACEGKKMKGPLPVSPLCLSVSSVCIMWHYFKESRGKEGGGVVCKFYTNP